MLEPSHRTGNLASWLRAALALAMALALVALAGCGGGASYAELPVRLHMSHTSINNFDIAFAQRVRERRYTGLVATEQTYAGTHTGIIPAAFADAIAFAFAP